jgi:hypothetical protein
MEEVCDTDIMSMGEWACSSAASEIATAHTAYPSLAPTPATDNAWSEFAGMHSPSPPGLWPPTHAVLSQRLVVTARAHAGPSPPCLRTPPVWKSILPAAQGRIEQRRSATNSSFHCLWEAVYGLTLGELGRLWTDTAVGVQEAAAEMHQASLERHF